MQLSVCADFCAGPTHLFLDGLHARVLRVPADGKAVVRVRVEPHLHDVCSLDMSPSIPE